MTGDGTVSYRVTVFVHDELFLYSVVFEIGGSHQRALCMLNSYNTTVNHYKILKCAHYKITARKGFLTVWWKVY